MILTKGLLGTDFKLQSAFLAQYWRFFAKHFQIENRDNALVAQRDSSDSDLFYNARLKLILFGANREDVLC